MGTKNNSLIMDIFLVHVKHFQRAFRIIFLIDRKSIGTNRPQKALFLGPNSVFSSKFGLGAKLGAFCNFLGALAPEKSGHTAGKWSKLWK